MEVAKALLVDVEGLEQGGIIGTTTATTYNEGWSECLECSDHLQDQIKEDIWCQEWERDPDKFADRSCALNTCCLIHFPWDLLKTR